MIEHLERWQELLSEAKRVLKPAGVLLVSTPNRDYYAESRAQAGPNPFHVREFDRREFTSALEAAFPHVALWTQNHVEGLGFLPARGGSDTGVLDAPDERDPDNAYFFVTARAAGCPVACTEALLTCPVSGNLLREREHHVALLEGELAQKTAWLRQLEETHETLNQAHRELIAEQDEHNAWAARLNEELKQAGERNLGLEREAAERLAWVRDLEAQIARGRDEIERLDRENTDLRVAFEERTRWGESKAREVELVTGELQKRTAELYAANGEIARVEAFIAAVGDSMWVRFGRAVHLGPEVRGDFRSGSDR